MLQYPYEFVPEAEPVLLQQLHEFAVVQDLMAFVRFFNADYAVEHLVCGNTFWVNANDLQRFVFE